MHCGDGSLCLWEMTLWLSGMIIRRLKRAFSIYCNRMHTHTLDMVQVEGAKHSTTHINFGKSFQAKIDQLNPTYCSTNTGTSSKSDHLVYCAFMNALWLFAGQYAVNSCSKDEHMYFKQIETTTRHCWHCVCNQCY